MVAASVPLGICTATVYARLLRLGVRAPGPSIGFVGGITASTLLATSGPALWTRSRAGGPPAGVDAVVPDPVFALGGVGFVGGRGC